MQLVSGSMSLTIPVKCVRVHLDQAGYLVEFAIVTSIGTALNVWHAQLQHLVVTTVTLIQENVLPAYLQMV